MLKYVGYQQEESGLCCLYTICGLGNGLLM